MNQVNPPDESTFWNCKSQDSLIIVFVSFISDTSAWLLLGGSPFGQSWRCWNCTSHCDRLRNRIWACSRTNVPITPTIGDIGVCGCVRISNADFVSWGTTWWLSRWASHRSRSIFCFISAKFLPGCCRVMWFTRSVTVDRRILSLWGPSTSYCPNPRGRRSGGRGRSAGCGWGGVGVAWNRRLMRSWGTSGCCGGHARVINTARSA